MSDENVGGTKIMRRQPPPPPMTPPPMAQQPIVQPQIIDQPEQISYQRPQFGQKQNFESTDYPRSPILKKPKTVTFEEQSNPEIINPEIIKPKNNKSNFSFTNIFKCDLSDNLKTSILVCVLFVIFNSKIVWRQIIKLPFMGTVEPSMLALIINSILAGLAFFIITKLI